MVNYGITVDELLKKFFCKIHHPELIDSNKICFVYNAKNIKFGEQNPVEKYFKNNSVPLINIFDETTIKNDTGTNIEIIDYFVFKSNYDFD